MAFQWKVYEKSQRAELGTIAKIIGKDGEVELINKNLLDLSKSVALVLKKKNGESDTVACSKAVSELIRTKAVTLGQVVYQFPVIEFINNKSGELMNLVVSPSTEGVPNKVFKVKDLKDTPYQATNTKKPAFEEFVAW